MKTVTDIIRSCPAGSIRDTFSSIEADFGSIHPVKVSPGSVIERDPLMAGIQFHRFLLRMADNRRLSESERTYLPFLSVARREMERMGVWKMEIESPVIDKTTEIHGCCDLIVRGGPKRVGFVEFKLVSEAVTAPRPRDLCQLGLYAHLGRGWARSSWGALIYVQPYGEVPSVRIFGYRDITPLLSAAAELLVDDAIAA